MLTYRNIFTMLFLVEMSPFIGSQRFKTKGPFCTRQDEGTCSCNCRSKDVQFGTDCGDITGTKSGVYYIKPEGEAEPVSVYCDMKTDGGKWTVFQRRFDGSENFLRGWHDYEHGFGEKTGEYWLGNRYIHSLTRQGEYELRVDLTDYDGVQAYAVYRVFSVGDAASKYLLTVENYSGDAGDSLSYHSGLPFSTHDWDNDPDARHCAEQYKGAWWYNQCHKVNLNALYQGTPNSLAEDGMNWADFRGYTYSLKATKMSIRKI